MNYVLKNGTVNLEAVKDRLETKEDGHDFFSREMCDFMIKNGINESTLQDYLDAAELPITVETLQLINKAAENAVTSRKEDLEDLDQTIL